VSEPYKCWRCGGTTFSVHTNLKDEAGIAVVGVICNNRDCKHRKGDAVAAMAPSLIEAFVATSKKPEPESKK
jgi:hypothetical protein